MGKPGDPEDFAYAMLFLTSDESKYITGQHWLRTAARSFLNPNLLSLEEPWLESLACNKQWLL